MSRRVAFVELYRQWPGYFADSLNAAYAGELRARGHAPSIFKVFLHADEAPLEALLAALAAQRWDLLVVDRVWSPALLEQIRAAAGGAEIAVLHWAAPAQFPGVRYRVSPTSRQSLAGLVDALGDAEAERRVPNLWVREGEGWRPPGQTREFRVLEELAAPLDLAYDRAQVFGLPAEEPAGTRYLILNMGCPYRGAKNDSGFFEGADLSDGPAWGDSGCTFCNVGPYERQTPAERRALMARQLDALREHGPYRRLVVQDEYIFRDLDVLAELLAERGLGVEVLVRARTDYLESCEAALERALALLRPVGGRVSLYLIGFENFSDAELGRYNKGQTAAEIEAAIARLDGLVARHDNLGLTRSHGFILFGPWTTLADLERNAEAMRRVRFERFRGRATASKLRLNPGAALIHRARADGLLLEAHDEAHEDNAAETGYQAEVPYRFLHPEVAEVWALLNGPGRLEGRDEVARLEEALRRVRT